MTDAGDVGAEGGLKAAARSFMRSTGLLALYFRAIELKRVGEFPKPPALAPDGRPLPSRLQMVRIGGVADWQFFYKRGKSTAEALVEAARRAGADPQAWTRILDWGCGCGRIARHMPALTPATIVGRDIDAYTLAWCAKNLPGDYRACSLDPPLDIAEASIDFAYGFSVLTHLTAPTQKRWFAEFGRVIRPGGLAVLTFHDHQQQAMDHARMRDEDAGVSVTEWALEGSNLVAAFQELDTIADASAGLFDVVGSQTSRETPFDQAVAVLRRR